MIKVYYTSSLKRQVSSNILERLVQSILFIDYDLV